MYSDVESREQEQNQPYLQLGTYTERLNLPSSSNTISGQDLLLSAGYLLEDLRVDIVADQDSITTTGELVPELKAMEYVFRDDLDDVPFEFGNAFSNMEDDGVGEPLEIAEMKFDSTAAAVVAKAPTVNAVATRSRGRGPTRVAKKVQKDEILRIRAPRKNSLRAVRVVPEEEKTAEYYAHRRKNTEAARKCREKKRALDERRVEVIKAQQEKIMALQRDVFKLQRENRSYQTIFDRITQAQQEQILNEQKKIKDTPQRKAPAKKASAKKAPAKKTPAKKAPAKKAPAKKVQAEKVPAKKAQAGRDRK